MNLARLLLLPALSIALSCEEYEPPPQATLEGLSDGVLAVARPETLVVDFGTPIDPATLSVKVALFEADAEGDLGDEDLSPTTELRVLARHDPRGGDVGAKSALDPALPQAPTKLRLNLDAPLPTGTPLVLLVEGGLRATTTNRVAKRRQRIRFTTKEVLDASIAE